MNIIEQSYAILLKKYGVGAIVIFLLCLIGGLLLYPFLKSFPIFKIYNFYTDLFMISGIIFIIIFTIIISFNKIFTRINKSIKSKRHTNKLKEQYSNEMMQLSKYRQEILLKIIKNKNKPTEYITPLYGGGMSNIYDWLVIKDTIISNKFMIYIRPEVYKYLKHVKKVIQ